jgi:prepilin-type N-terminal cleavage/methylation domain-containing protein
MKTLRGFTLIELLVVISIIGILSAVVLTSLNAARIKGRDARRIADVKQIQLALALYFDSNGVYPLTIGTPGSSLLEPDFIATLPSDPSNGATYSYSPYAATSNATVCTGYHIGTSLESGTTHGELTADADFTAAKRATAGLVVCTNGTADFDGTDALNVPCTAGDVGITCYDARN